MAEHENSEITADSIDAFCDELNVLDVLAERRLHGVTETFDRVRSLLTLPEGKDLALEELQKLEQALTQGQR